MSIGVRLLVDVVLALASRWLDRQRGTSRDDEVIAKLPALLGLGYIAAIQTGHWFDWSTLSIVAGVAFAHNFSFGEPLGHALTGRGGQVAPDGSIYEYWQVGDLLKKNPWVALALRGSVVGLGFPMIVYGVQAVTALMTWLVPSSAGVVGMIPAEAMTIDWLAVAHISAAYALAFPLAPAYVRYVAKMPTKTKKQSGMAWAKNEDVRGLLTGVFLAVIRWGRP